MIIVNARRLRAAALAAIALASSIVLGSCLGVDARAKVAASGSGSVDLRYTISRDLVEFGELEGNKAMLPVPISKEDFERGLAPYPTLKLESWTQKDSGTDRVVDARVSFTDLRALATMLDPRGTLASYKAEGGRNTLSMSFGEQMAALDAETESLAREAFTPYSMKLSLQTPSPPIASVSAHAGVKSWIEGATARFESPMTVIALSPEPVVWTVTW